VADALSTVGPGDAATSLADSKRAFIGSAAANCVATVTWWMQPVLIGYWVSTLNMSESHAGFIVAMEMAAMGLGGALFARVVNRGSMVGWATGAILVAVTGGAASVLATHFGALMALRALVGAVTGVVMVCSYLAIGRASSPDRNFAKINLVNMLFGIGLLDSLPYLHSWVPSISPLAVCVLAMVLLIPATALLPSGLIIQAGGALPGHAPTASGNRPVARPHQALRVYLVVAITLVVGVISGMAWAVLALIGARIGLSGATIDHAMAASIGVSIGVTGISAVIGTRFGRLIPLTIAVTAIAISIVIFSRGATALSFEIAAALDMAGISFAMPYLFGLAATQDPEGKAAGYIGSVSTISGALSPFVGGLVIQYLGVAAMGPIAIVVLSAAMAGLLYIGRTSG
jgi:hypothetical protein